jgi:NADP-dependent 3-hydroxy acid dehydrogenase YdfG
MHTRRTAVVTGATSGIGQATAALFLTRGVRVVANGRRPERLAGLQELIDDPDKHIITLSGDIREHDLIQRAFTAADAQWNAFPDLVVLCAGRGLPGSILTSDHTQWRSLLEENYLAILTQLRNTAQQFLAQAQNEDDPTVRDLVIIGSTVGREVSQANPVYGSTKFAVHSLTESLRRELCGHNIRVTLIEPGFVKSDFQRNAGYDPDWFADVERQNGPLLTPDDVASTIEFVISRPAHVHLDDIRIRATRQRT